MLLVRTLTPGESSCSPGERPPFGVNLIGHVSANTGLGVSARHVASVIRDRGVPLAVLDIPAGDAYDNSFSAHTVRDPEALPYAINLLHLPPQTLSGSVAMNRGRRGLLFHEGVLNAGLLMWEHLTVPARWRPPLEILDAIVAPSAFVRAAVERSLDGVLTVSTPHPVALPDGVRPQRERFGLPAEAVVFAASFEMYSPERKNGQGVIDAFRQAFSGDPGVALAIRHNNSALRPGAVTELRRLTTGDPRIHIIDEPLSYRDVLCLYASADVFVSLHRAEGLGLPMMESMALGKPVVATAWSGNLSFMDAENGCLVGYRLVPVVARNPEYRRAVLGRSAVWAEPDRDDAAAWMARLARDPGLRAAIGGRARESMAAHQASAARAGFVDQLESIWRQQLDLPALARKRSSEFRARWELQCAQALGPSRLRDLMERHVLWRLRRRVAS